MDRQKVTTSFEEEAPMLTEFEILRLDIRVRSDKSNDRASPPARFTNLGPVIVS